MRNSYAIRVWRHADRSSSAMAETWKPLKETGQSRATEFSPSRKPKYKNIRS